MNLFEADFDQLREIASAAARSSDQETLSHEFIGKLEEKVDNFREARQELVLGIAKGVQTLVAAQFEASFGKSEGKIYKVAGGVIDTAGKFFDAVEAYGGAKKALATLNNPASGGFILDEANALTKARGAAVVAAFDLGFSAGKVIAMAASDADVAKIYSEQVKQFEEDGGWLTVGAGVLSTLNFDRTAGFIQGFHDAGGISLQPYVDVVLKQRAYHAERTTFYLNGISAP